MWLFTDNSEFLGDRTLSQAPLYAFQLNAEYTFKPNLWAGIGLRQTVGGRPSVDGVEGVLSRLAVNPRLRDLDELPDPQKRLGQRLVDTALLAKIRAALHLDRETRAIDVSIDVSSGVVVLRGEVPTEELAERIRSRVAGVSGVESIEDELRLPES